MESQAKTSKVEDINEKSQSTMMKQHDNSLKMKFTTLESAYEKHILNPDVKELYDQAKIINKDFRNNIFLKYLDMIEDKIVYFNDM